MILLDESLCTVEICRTDALYVIKLKVGDEADREFKAVTFENAFEQVINEITEEFNLDL